MKQKIKKCINNLAIATGYETIENSSEASQDHPAEKEESFYSLASIIYWWLIMSFKIVGRDFYSYSLLYSQYYSRHWINVYELNELISS